MKTTRYSCALAMLLGLVGFASGQKIPEGMRPLERAAAKQGSTDMLPAGAVGRTLRKPVRYFDGAAQRSIRPNAAAIAASRERKPSRTRAATFENVLEVGSADSPADIFMSGSADSSGNVFGRDRARAAASFDPRARLTWPANGSTLRAIQDFYWDAGVEALDYWLWVGSCQDCTDILDEDMGLRRQERVNLPTDGRVIFVTLFTFYRDNWYWYDYQFVAADGRPTPSPASMSSPAAGSTLSQRQTFAWDRGEFVDEYYLWVGSCQDCTDVLDESQALNLSRAVNIPADSRTIFVTLFSLIAGEWYWYDYQYRAPGGVSETVRLDITNGLAYAVNIAVNGAVVGSVPAYETRSHDAQASSLELTWELVRPTLSSRALGDEMRGVFETIRNPSGTYGFTIDSQVGSQPYFLPLITNRTSVPVLIEVNGGLQSQNRCQCVAGPNATNVATGYYRLYTNGNVRVWRSGSNYTGSYQFWGTDSDGRVAGRTLPRYVEADTAIARLVVTVAP